MSNKVKSWSYAPKMPENATKVDHCKKLSLNMKNSVDLRLYRMTQAELYVFIVRVLRSKGIPFTEIDGNIYSIQYADKPCFVAHMDMIEEVNVTKTLYIDPSDTSLHRDGGTLGADDRAGINVIMNHIDDELNFVFTRDEEVGCLGAHSLMGDVDFLKELDKVNFLIQPDRRGCRSKWKALPIGSGDIIEYCEPDLVAAIEKVLPDYLPAIGSYTDIAQMDTVKPGVNLSCGYYSAHTSSEYLVLEEYEYLNSMIPALNAIEGTFKVSPPYVAPPKKVYPPYTGYNNYDDHYDEYYGYGGYSGTKWKDKQEKILLKGKLIASKFNLSTYCDVCGYFSGEVALVAGVSHVCSDCAHAIVTELSKEEE